MATSLITGPDRRLEEIINRELRPRVKRIDADALYPASFYDCLGRDGYLRSDGMEDSDVRIRETRLVEATASVCMTSAFNLWCHLALLTYVRLSDNGNLARDLLRPLENGGLRGGTGLSNPMKYYAGLDRLYLTAARKDGGYVLEGQLPMVSNLGVNHCFAVIADAGDRKIMAVVSCATEGLSMTERLGFLGLNGSATYSCRFNGVFVPDERVVSEGADDYVGIVRPIFVLYQIPLGLGVAAASIRSIRQAEGKQDGCNRHLPVQAEQLERDLERLRQELYRLAAATDMRNVWKPLLQVRLDAVYLTLQAVQACMLHQGSAGYALHSGPSRRLREAYFFANLTPTVRHLEKLLAT